LSFLSLVKAINKTCTYFHQFYSVSWVQYYRRSW